MQEAGEETKKEEEELYGNLLEKSDLSRESLALLLGNSKKRKENLARNQLWSSGIRKRGGGNVEKGTLSQKKKGKREMQKVHSTKEPPCALRESGPLPALATVKRKLRKIAGKKPLAVEESATEQTFVLLNREKNDLSQTGNEEKEKRNVLGSLR